MRTTMHPQYRKEAPGVRVKIILLACSLLLPSNSIANKNPESLSNENRCAYGSHKQLYQFFTDENYAVIAQGKRIQPSGKVKDFADVLFLLSPDMDYFHAVTLSGIRYDHFKACIFSSGREIDFQFAPPIPNLLERKNREHLVFLEDNLPKDAACPADDDLCLPWSEWSASLEQTFLLSGYSYSELEENDPYNEIVELTLDNKTIRPTRGVLTEHARVKYALRLRNELSESARDIKAAKDAYIQIHDEVDHKLPLIILAVTKDRAWSITQIDRESGLAKRVIHGVELELYPMRQTEYQRLINEKQPLNTRP